VLADLEADEEGLDRSEESVAQAHGGEEPVGFSDRTADLAAFAERCCRYCDDNPAGFLELPPPKGQDPGPRMVWECCRGFAASILTRSDEAYPAYERALELAVKRNDLLWQSRALAGLGMVLGDIGDYAEAIERLEESRLLRRAIGDVDGEASSLNNLGNVHLQMPGFDRRAIELFEEARARYLVSGNARGAAAALMNLSEGLIHLTLSAAETDGADGTGLCAHAERALECACTASVEADEQGMERVSIGARLNAVHAAAELGRTDLGDRLLAEARDRLTRYPAPNLEIGARLATGHLLRRKGRYQDAVQELRAGVADIENVDANEYRAMLSHELVLALEAHGDLAGALAAMRRYHREQVEERDRTTERRVHWLKARLDVERAEVAAALQRQRADLLAEQNTELSRQALVDGLTFLPNRRALMERLGSELAVVTPRFGFALTDLDHFKQVNDRYSHLIGDQVLRTVAELTRCTLREVDLPARYGGEEFALILVVTDPIEMRLRCDRLRELVAAHPWHELAPGLRQTISIGATLARPGDTVETLISRADERLYAAKRSGRNRVNTDRTGSESEDPGSGDLQPAPHSLHGEYPPG
jgi:diguanylate cyclase (GGDEF)-like protein